MVKLINDQEKFIGNIKTGDEILTINQFEIVPSEMIFMLDKQKSKKGILYIFILLFKLNVFLKQNFIHFKLFLVIK